MALNAVSKPNDVCLTMIRQLADFAGRNNPHDLNNLTYGATEAVKASRQLGGAMSVPTTMFKNPTGGGAATENRFGVKYRVRRCVDDVAADLNPCVDEGLEPNTWNYKDFIFSAPVTHSFKIPLATLRGYCESYNEEFMYLLKETYDTLKRKVNARYISQLASNFGKYYAPDCDDAAVSDVDTRTVGFVDTAGNPNAQGFYILKQMYDRLQFTGEPLVIGSDVINLVQFNQPLFAGNVNGFDVNRMGGLRWFKDYQLDTSLAPDQLISIAPGAVHPLTWSRYTGDFELRLEDQLRINMDLGAFFGEGSGEFMVDHTMHIDKCGADIEYLFKFYVYTDLLMLEDSMLSEDCGQCSNGILLWNHDCVDPSCAGIKVPTLAPETEG
jgi:hypothetical protein